MPTNPDPADTAQSHVLSSVEEQIRDLQPTLDKQVEIAGILAELNRLNKLITDASLKQLLQNNNNDGIIDKVAQIQAGKQPGSQSIPATLSDFGGILVDLYSLQPQIQGWLDQQQATIADRDQLEGVLLSVIIQVRQLLNYRPDVGAIMDDLTAIKHLRGGPADAVAFHDFHVLQLAFRSVWVHAFDDNLK